MEKLQGLSGRMGGKSINMAHSLTIQVSGGRITYKIVPLSTRERNGEMIERELTFESIHQT